MDSLFQAPVATAFDAASSFVSAGAYLLVGVAALAYAPRDARARLFLAVAVASAAPYGITTLMWLRGTAAALSRPVVMVTALSLMMGSLALLHFTQVFPWRRPWIRAYAPWLLAGYGVIPIAAAIVAWLARRVDFGAMTGEAAGGLDVVAALALLGIVMPAIFILGVVTPFAGLLSLYKSWLAAKAAGIDAARRTTLWMLISQMAGGVLTILIIPLLHLVAPSGPWVTIAAALLFGFGLLMPAAFAVGVWKLGVLDLDIDALPS
jgi:hypothetical protein